MYSGRDHTFVVCAYGENPYLKECVESLLNQTVKSQIIMTTSTPNRHISEVARKYGIPLYVNSTKANIASDWNFAYERCATPLVTLAHQDDVYVNRYTEKVIENINRSFVPLIAFTDYAEIREGRVVDRNRLLSVKRILLSPLKIRFFWTSRFVRRRILSLGSAICCPSVTLVKVNLKGAIFKAGMKSNIDWEAWEKISKYKGSFVYCCDILLYHRIYEESTTTDIIKDGQRCLEDVEMYEKFWPRWLARLLEKIYRNGEKSNQLH